MSRKITLSFLPLVVFISLCCCSAAYSAPRPLTRSELLALVSGRVMPENVVWEIKHFGITFTPDVGYLSLLKSAGANPKVLVALSGATINVAADSDSAAETPEFLRRLGRAGKALVAKDQGSAVEELSARFDDKAQKTAAGFVMGNILFDAERIPEGMAVYQQILALDPDFPQVHTRLSYAFVRMSNPQEALRQTKAALERNPDDPVAHLNASGSYQLLENPAAIKEEVQQALRCKPDFAMALSAYGDVLRNQGDYQGAVAQFKKALRLEPDNFRARQGLASALLHVDASAGVEEFRKMEAAYPDSDICHVCLGNSLMQIQKYDEAEKEFRTAIRLNSGMPEAHYGLGEILETKKQDGPALIEYRRALKLDDNYAPGHTAIGMILLKQKEYAASLTEFKRVEEIEPANWFNHDMQGEALAGLGKSKDAIAEFKKALLIDPKQLQPRLNLAQELERSGDWAGALENFHQAALDEPRSQLHVIQRYYDADSKYVAAKQRFEKHLADLHASGKTADADALVAAVHKQEASAGLDSQYHDILMSIRTSIGARKFEEAEASAQQAIALAEKIQPMDGRLPEAVGILGNVYLWRFENKKAEESFQRQLQLIEKLNGADSPLITDPLQNLAVTALAQKDYATSESLFKRIYEFDVKHFGENSESSADALRGLAHNYRMQGDYAKGETAILQAVQIYEKLYGPEDFRIAIPLTTLCDIYQRAGKSDKAEACHSRLNALPPPQQ